MSCIHLHTLHKSSCLFSTCSIRCCLLFDGVIFGPSDSSTWERLLSLTSSLPFFLNYTRVWLLGFTCGFESLTRHCSGHPSRGGLTSMEGFIAVSWFPPGFTVLLHFTRFMTHVHTFSPFSVILTCFCHCTAWSLLYSSSPLRDTLTKMEMRKKCLNKFRCPEEKNSHFARKILKEGGMRFV